MKCEKIRQLLLTDHIDGEIDDNLREEVERHLKTCSACRELERVLRSEISAPLKAAGVMSPPESVWENITEKIHESGKISVLELARERLFDIFTLKRPVLALATVMTLFIMVISVYTANDLLERRYVDNYMEDQMDLLYDLDNGSGENGSLYDIGIPLEEFML